ncbi:MAG: hypothetical protein WB660_06640 [Candidatus Sulfotelmatobacter sp.]
MQKSDSVSLRKEPLWRRNILPPAPKITSPPSNRDGDGNHVYNEILLGLPPEESDTLLPKLEFVRLKLHQVLHEAGETLKSGYFCNTGMFSFRIRGQKRA